MSTRADWNGVPAGLRWSLGAALLAAAAAHLPVIPMHLREAPYLGLGFVVFVLVATVVAGGVVTRRVHLVRCPADREHPAGTSTVSPAGTASTVIGSGPNGSPSA